MAQSSNYKAPSLLTSDIQYENWKKEISILQLFTTLDKKKQGPAISLSLSEQPREAILELDIKKLDSDNGVENTLAKLDTLCLKDEHCSACEAYEKFEKFT